MTTQVPCPVCNAWTETMETRKTADGVVRRRYECGNLHRFTTKDNIVVRADMAQRSHGRPRNTKEET